MVKRFEQQSTEKLGTKKQNGKILHGFRHQPNKYNDFTVWVNPKTKLPVEIEIKHLNMGRTLFLDELCELSFALQAKLLRALEEKAFERLGGNKTIHSDTRIIAATNRDIEAMVRSGNFREDLYYRINVLRIHLPPLRERHECIKPLAEYLVDKLSRSVRKHVEAFTPDVIELFQDYTWPGNIREMSNTIERAILLADGSVIQKENVSLPKINVMSPPEKAPQSLRLSEGQEKSLISQALEKNLWIQKDAAKELGITPRALNYRIKKLGITHSRWRKHK